MCGGFGSLAEQGFPARFPGRAVGAGETCPVGKDRQRRAFSTSWAPHFHVALVVVDFILHSSYRLVDQIAVLSNDMLVYNQLRAPTIDTDSYIKVERCFSSAQANHNTITHSKRARWEWRALSLVQVQFSSISLNWRSICRR